jgi:hypothetical protein
MAKFIAAPSLASISFYSQSKPNQDEPLNFLGFLQQN